MKSKWFVFVLIVLTVFSSCSMETENPQSGGNGGGSTEQTYVMPFWAVKESTPVIESRGITQMPVGEAPWGDDLMRSSSVMQVLPAMIGFERINDKSFDQITKSAENEILHLLGFDVKAETGVWAENEDGIFLRYTIIYENTPVGFIEYYYNNLDKMFSYRQLVLLTFNQFGQKMSFILALEYDDISVESNDSAGTFSFGALENGDIALNAFADNISLTEPNHGPYSGEDFQKGISFTRNYMSGVSSKNRFQSFAHPDLAKATYLFDDEEIYELIRGLDGSNANNFIDLDSEMKAANLDFLLNAAKEVYVNADRWTEEKTYSSYKDFRDASISELCPSVEAELYVLGNKKEGYQPHSSANPVIFSWSQYSSAAAQIFDIESKRSSGMEFCSASKKTWEQTDFGEFYEEIKPEECADDNELVCALIRAHLTACGIADENYIANYAYAELHESYKHGLGIWPMKIDSRDPETFRKEYDEQVEKVFPSVFS